MFRNGMLSFALMQMVLRCCSIDVEMMMVCRCWYLTVSQYWTSSFKLLSLGYMAANDINIKVLDTCGLHWQQLVVYKGHSKDFPMFLPAGDNLDMKVLCDTIYTNTEIEHVNIVGHMLGSCNYYLVSKMLSLADLKGDASPTMWRAWERVILDRTYLENQKATLYIHDWLLALLRNGMSPNAECNLKGRSESVDILMKMCNHGAKRCVRVLLDNGAIVNAADQFGKTALMYAFAHVDIIAMLLESGADACMVDNKGHTAFMIGCMKGGDYGDAVLALLHAGGDNEILGNKKDFALMLASRSGYHDCVNVLLSKGANPDIQNFKGEHVLTYASPVNSPRAKKECDNGSIIKVWPDPKNCIALLLNAGASEHLEDWKGNTVLMHAILHRGTDVVRLLLMYNVGVNVQNVAGDTALMRSCDTTFETTSDFVRSSRTVLLDSGADVDVQNVKGVTALMVAAENADHECIKELLDAKASPNIKDCHGRTALMFIGDNVGHNYGKHRSAEKSVRHLVAKGADLNVVDEDGISTLMSMAGSPDCIMFNTMRILLHAGADVSIRDKHGFDALMYAVKHGNKYSVKALLEVVVRKSLDVDVRNNDGDTALEIAVDCKAMDAIRLLLNAGANANVVDGDVHKFMSSVV